MIDILHGLGLRLLALGHHTPFMASYISSLLPATIIIIVIIISIIKKFMLWLLRRHHFRLL